MSTNQQHLTQDLSPRELYTRSREQYKNKNIKQYISQTCEDSMGSKVSDETCLLAQRQASDPVAASIEAGPLAGTSCQERSGNVISPRDVYTRWSGISVHHVRSRKGVKIGITLQRPEWANEGRTLQITAELKRYDRLREVKTQTDDSDFFELYLTAVKEKLFADRNRNACLGRAHQRGSRRAWIQDTLVLGYMEQDVIKSVIIYIEGDQFEVSMDHVMSEQQQRVYHSTGIHGQIRFTRRSPRIDELPTTQKYE